MKTFYYSQSFTDSAMEQSGAAERRQDLRELDSKMRTSLQSLGTSESAMGKQGYMGDLEAKTKVELTELLRRQERLLANKKFIQKLPDKGKKISDLTGKLQILIAQKQDVDNTVSMFDRLQIHTPGDTDDEDPLKMVINRGVKEKQFVNTYQKVIAAEKKSTQHTKEKDMFKPNKSIKEPDPAKVIEKLTHDGAHIQHGTVPARIKAEKTAADRGVVSESAVDIPHFKHDSTKPVPLEESFRLQLEQKQKYEEMQAQFAAERLVQRLHSNFAGETPHTFQTKNLQYRENDKDIDSDDDEDLETQEIDYQDVD